MSVDTVIVSLVSIGIGAGLGAGSKYLFDIRFLDRQLKRQHNQRERDKLRELISKYQGRVLEAALDWDRRMVQIYDGQFKDLKPGIDNREKSEQYYYQSVVFRFLQLTAIARRFEMEAFYIKADIANKEDFDLLRYAKSFLWVMIHAEITPDDGQPGAEHFRSDAFRPFLDLCYAIDKDERKKPILPEVRSRQGELIFDWRRFLALLDKKKSLRCENEVNELLDFFDGVCPEEQRTDGSPRRRWDRLVALHLLVLAFIGTCGYDWDSRDLNERTEQAAGMLLFPDDLRREFKLWLPRLGLAAKKEITYIEDALERNEDRNQSNEGRAERVVDRVGAERPPPAALGPRRRFYRRTAREVSRR